MNTLIKSVWQITLLCLFSFIMDKLADLLHLKIPGNILGLFIVFTLLQTKIIRLEWIELGAKWLLAELLLFFIPSAVGIMKYKNILADKGLYITLVIILSTAIVMICSGLVAKKISERKKHLHHDCSI